MKGQTKQIEQGSSCEIRLLDTLNDRDSIPFHLLELADPSREMIQSYLGRGKCFGLEQAGACIGVLFLLAVEKDCLEIKNIAIDPSHQGLGYGTALLEFAETYAREQRYERLRIGTGNSSLDQLRLYQRFGFELHGIIQNFFTDHYPEPIIENDIPCKHMVVLEKELTT
jgi:aminoglycoside 6'-N-acetyltransferase I